MGDSRSFDGTDKLAGIFLGTPLLIGCILLVLALFSPGTAPYKDRATVIPVAIGLLVLGGGGGSAYLRWRFKRQRQGKLDAKAAAGALRLAPGERTPRLVGISFALADEFLLPPGSCQLPQGAGRLTVQGISGSVAAAIHRLEQQNQMLIKPAGVKAASALVAPFAEARGQQLRMGTRLDKVIPMRRRREMWTKMRTATLGRVGGLAVPSWGIGVASALAIALTFGITIPLAQWLDQEHPIHDPSPAVKLLASVVVRGGFFAILIFAVIGFALLFRLLFPTFPAACRTVGQLSAYLDSVGVVGNERWTADQVSSEVRRIIAHTLHVAETQVHPATECR